MHIRSSASPRINVGIARIDTSSACVDAARTHTCIDVSTASPSPRASEARHAICGPRMRAVGHRNCLDFAWRASRCARCVSATSTDTFNTSIRTRRSRRLRAYRCVECEKFACVVASTHRSFRHTSRSSHVDAHDDVERVPCTCMCSRCTRMQHRALL